MVNSYNSIPLQKVYGLSGMGIESLGRYPMQNSLSFYHGEISKLQKNDRQLNDCRIRRKAAIVRISRMVQTLDNE